MNSFHFKSSDELKYTMVAKLYKRILMLRLFFLIIQCNCAVSVPLQSSIGKFLTVNVESPKHDIVHCYVRRPNDDYFLRINDTKLQLELKYIGENDNSCSFKILNVTDDHIGKWQVDTFYKVTGKIGYKVQNSSNTYSISGHENKIFFADFNDSPVIKSIRRDGTRVQCFLKHPSSLHYVNLGKIRNSTDFDYLGAIDNSCTFKIKNIDILAFGNWELLSVHHPHDGSMTYTKTLSFAIKERDPLLYQEKKNFLGEIGKSLTLKLKSLYKPRIHCVYRRPLDNDFSGIANDELKGNFEFIGANNNSCSFVIKNLTDELIGNWQLVTSYKIEKKNGPNETEKKVTHFTVDGIEEKSFVVEIGGSITIGSLTREDTYTECSIYGPHDPIYSLLTNEKWKFKIKIIEKRSCSFKLIHFTKDYVGEWILTTTYLPKNGREIFKKYIIFSIKSEIQSLIRATPGQSVIVYSPSLEGTVKKCWFLRPTGFPWLTVDDNEWKSHFEFIGGSDNSCSFKIIRMTNDYFGKWNILTEYKPLRSSEITFQRDSFDILNGFQQKESNIFEKLIETSSTIQIFYELIAVLGYDLLEKHIE